MHGIADNYRMIPCGHGNSYRWMVLYPTTVASIKGLIGRLERKGAPTVAGSYLVGTPLFVVLHNNL